MEFSLNKEQNLIRKIASEFAQKYVEPIAEKIDKENFIPGEIINTLGELGLLGIPIRRIWGIRCRLSKLCISPGTNRQMFCWGGCYNQCFHFRSGSHR
jgi:alkylation response protein AidB-like acyl-CoA dehydrogenase